MSQALCIANVGVFMGREQTENIVVLVYRLAKVSSLLLVPPVGIGIAKLSGHSGRVYVAAILLSFPLLAMILGE
jgi:hypothetical protein